MKILRVTRVSNVQIQYMQSQKCYYTTNIDECFKQRETGDVIAYLSRRKRVMSLTEETFDDRPMMMLPTNFPELPTIPLRNKIGRAHV